MTLESATSKLSETGTRAAKVTSKHFEAAPRIHKGTIVGGVLFGLGWAIAGACPGVAFALPGEGKLWVLVTLAGIAVGTLGYTALHRKYLRFGRGSCG